MLVVIIDSGVGSVAVSGSYSCKRRRRYFLLTAINFCQTDSVLNY